MKIQKTELLLDAKASLGEGPSWDAASQSLWWVNILDGELRQFDPRSGQDRRWAMGRMIGCSAPAAGGGLVVGLEDGIAWFDPDSGERRWLAQPESSMAGNRWNDGKCDPFGRFLSGTMETAETNKTGSLYSLAPDGSLKRLLGDIGISNGLAWNPDFSVLYYIDTPTSQVRAFDYDRLSGEIANPRVVVSVPIRMGWPDGMTADRQGRLWIALWGGEAVTVWDPADGRLLETIKVPAKNVSSCCFGGPDLNELWVTTARKGVSEAELRRLPATGGVFRIVTDVAGSPTWSYGA